MEADVLMRRHTERGGGGGRGGGDGEVAEFGVVVCVCVYEGGGL